MAHYPKPWFRASRGVWYVELQSKQHNLGPDQEAAFRTYHELMAAPPSASVRRVPSDSLEAIFSM
jgi:hypothetical protein